MPLKLKDKQAIVTDLDCLIAQALSVVVADYRGLTVTQMDGLRRDAKNANVTARVFRNTLAKRAIVGTQFDCLDKALLGPVIMLFSTDEPGAAARLLKDFIKMHKAMEVRGIALGGELLGPEKLEAVASLPTRDEALAQLMSVMQAPVTKLVRTLAEPYAMAVRTFAAVCDQSRAA